MWLGASGDISPVTVTPQVDPNTVAAAIGTAQTQAANNGDSDNWLAYLTPLVTAGLQFWNQQQVLDLNKQLILQGKAPLSAAQLAAISPGLNLGISPDTQNMIFILGAGIAVLAMLWMLSNRSS